MLIKNTKSPPGRRLESRDSQSKDVGVLTQLVVLTKQNRYLKTQLDCLKKQYEKVESARNKYKQKYKDLKRKIQNNQKSKKSQPKLMRRQNSGKIYRQPKFLNYSPITKGNESQIDPPSTREQLHRMVSQPHLQQSQNKIIYVEDPYLIATTNQKYKETGSIQRISKQIASIFQMLQNMGKAMDSRQSNVSRFEQKFQNVETILSKYLQEFKKHLSQLVVHKLESEKNEQKIQISNSDEIRDKSYSLPLKKHQLQNKKAENVSGMSPPQKDQEDPYDQMKKCNQKKQLKSNISGNQISHDNQKVQKLIQSRSHKSLYNSKKIKQSQYLRQKNKVNKKKQDSDDSSTRSKWQMLNQIGKQLKNWKIAYSDESLLQKSNEENKKYKVKITQ